MIQIRLGEYCEVDPEKDPLGRHQIGWREGMDPKAVWEAARYQVFNPNRALMHETALVINSDGIVVCAAKFDGVTRFWPPAGQNKIRYALHGEPVEDERVGKPSEYEQSSNNSVKYVPGVD